MLAFAPSGREFRSVASVSFIPADSFSTFEVGSIVGDAEDTLRNSRPEDES